MLGLMPMDQPKDLPHLILRWSLKRSRQLPRNHKKEIQIGLDVTHSRGQTPSRTWQRLFKIRLKSKDSLIDMTYAMDGTIFKAGATNFSNFMRF
jgi:hypothetical protein